MSYRCIEMLSVNVDDERIHGRYANTVGLGVNRDRLGNILTIGIVILHGVHQGGAAEHWLQHYSRF